MGKKTTEEFIEQINSLYPDKYTILGEYQGGQKPIETKYNECGHVGFPLAHTLLKGCNCGICTGKIRRNHDMFINDVNKMYPGKYTILGHFIKNTEPILVRYNDCGHEVETRAGYLLHGSGCPICTRGTAITQDEFDERFLKIAGEDYECLDKYKNSKQNMKILHKNCGTVFSRNVSNIFKEGCKCPKCNPSSAVYLVQGVNDIHTTNPEMESLLKYKEDAYNHTQFTNDKVWFVCPYCGNEMLKRCDNVATNGLSCNKCNTNYSYGERFISNFLSELDVDYDYQYNPDWIKPYFYDFQFTHNNKEYIIEVDGGWHFEKNNKSSLSLDDVKSRDEYKQKEAEKRGIEVIRLNYNYKGSDIKSLFLINSILNSRLPEIFNLEDVDFEKIINISSKSFVKIVADLWNSYEEKSSRKIMEELHIKNDDKIRKILYLAYELGMIKESQEQVKYLNRLYGIKEYGHNRSQKVMCNETGEIFNSIKEASEKYHGNVGNYFLQDNRKHAGKLLDGTPLTWTKIYDDNF